MPFIPVANTTEVQLFLTQDGQKIENVFHVLAAAPLDLTGLGDLTTLFHTWYSTNIAPLASSGVDLVGIMAIALDASNSPSLDTSVTPPENGGNSSPAMPNNVSVVVKWGTGLRGRSYRGRTYHIGLTESQVTGNTVESTALSDLSDGYNALLTALVAASQHLCVTSRFTNKAPRAFGVSTIVTGLSIDPTVDSQRRRLPGRGR